MLINEKQMIEAKPRQVRTLGVAVDVGILTFKTARKKSLAEFVEMPTDFEVDTLEGVMRGKARDLLMRGVNGELYPCDREIFEKSYEVVD